MFSTEMRQFFCPTRLLHGVGTLARLPDEVPALGGHSVLLVGDHGVAGAGLLDGAEAVLQQAGIPVTRFVDVPVDPGVECVVEGVDRLRQTGADLVVGVGGGSPMCAAKAIALLATNGGTIRDYEGFGKVCKPPLPTVCIPTTAGSGTEVSAVTIITDEERHIKMAIGSPLCYPQLAILDPELLASLPFRQAAASGLDALCHAVEAFLTTQATPLTDALALGAIELLGDNLVQAARTRDLAAKGACLLASSMANMACGNARLGLNHALTWPISSLFGVPHGLANGVMLPYVLEFILPAATAKMARVAVALGAPPDATDSEGAALAKAGVQRVKRLLLELEFPSHFTTDQLDPARIPEMVDMLLQQGIYSLFRQVTLRVAARDDLITLYERSMEGWTV